MRLFGWLRRGTAAEADGLGDWRREWTAAVEAPESADPQALRARLETAAASGTDVEIEYEMLEALEQLLELKRLAASSLPAIETQHRVVGTEPCHFTAPASQPNDEAQTPGRLLATPSRAIFIGGGRTSATPWHSVHRVARVERDVLFLRANGSPAAHYRFNTYGEAVTVAFLAQHFNRRRSL